MASTLADINISKSLPTKLSKQKKTHSEAFYYWAMVDEFLSEKE